MEIIIAEVHDAAHCQLNEYCSCTCSQTKSGLSLGGGTLVGANAGYVDKFNGRHVILLFCMEPVAAADRLHCPHRVHRNSAIMFCGSA